MPERINGDDMDLPSKKEDERYFWRRVKAEVGLYGDAGKRPRDIINEPGFPIHYKRAWMMLEKWAGRGFYDYGVTVDLGWITPEGMNVEADIRHLTKPKLILVLHL